MMEPVPPDSVQAEQPTDDKPTSAWIAREILPHVGMARNWLARHFGTAIDVDDVMQEAFCRITELESVAHIQSGRAYFFAATRAIAIDLLRSARVVKLKSMAEMEWLDVMDNSPLPEQVFEAVQELGRVHRLLSRLSSTCRKVIELRRLHGLSQAETARKLGISEAAVEHHVSRGIISVRKALAEQDARTILKGRPDWTSQLQPIRGIAPQPNGRRGSPTGR